MDARVLLLLLIALGTYCCFNATVITTSQSSVEDAIASELQINGQQYMMDDEDLCTFCEVVLAPIVEFLSNTTSQTEIMSVLHLFCKLTFIIKDECNAIVDHYVPMIFNETSSSSPKELCSRIGLCCNTSQNITENSCESCHYAVTEASLKLNHPDYQLDIVELLLKACNAMEDSVNNYCTSLVLANAQSIPVYAKQMLNGHAICNLLHDCNSPTNAAE